MTKPSKIFYNIEIYLTTGASFRCMECGKIYSKGVQNINATIKADMYA